MKNLYLLIAMNMLSCYLFGQMQNPSESKQIINMNQTKNLRNVEFKDIDISSLKLKSSKSIDYRWYNYATTMQNYVFPNGNSGNLTGQRLFPDTTVKIRYTDGLFAASCHGIAVVLDPQDEAFYSDTLPWNMTVSSNFSHKFIVDSVGLLCIYKRHNPDQDIVDTLKVEFITNLNYNNSGYYFTGMASDYGYDTVKFLGLKRSNVKFDYIKPNDDIKVYTVKLPLTYDISIDTSSNGFNYFYIASPQVEAGRYLAAATFRFVPGYTWTPNSDVLNETLNEFLFVSYEENGKNTFPSYKPKQYNQSYYLPSWAGFNPNNQWYKDALYVPTVAFTQPYALENHWIDFGLKVTNLGVSENKEKSIKLSQNMPNPAANQTYIEYQLKTSAEVTLMITDLTGNKVMEIKEGKRNAGTHNIRINTSTLSNGMYYYTLLAGNNSLTRKMIINK